MPYAVALHDAPAWIEVAYRGAVVGSDLEAALHEVLDIAQQRDLWLILADTSELTSDPSVFALYDVATRLSEARIQRRFREAIITGPDSLESARFYEDAMVNRGLVAKVFATRPEAEEWLAAQGRDLSA